jgi:ketosteroid isomerase-like protein
VPPSVPGFESPERCEAAFYAAFEACDLDAMMAVWADDAPLLCVHPGGPALNDRGEVRESWRRIFQGGGGVRFVLSHLQVTEDARVSVRFVHENIHHGPGYRSVAVVLASNVFVRESGGWRLSAHHASPGPAPPAGGDAAHGALH